MERTESTTRIPRQCRSPIPPTSAGHGGRRLLVIGLDQAVCSLTNFLVLLFALRTLDLAQFGTFSLVFAGYVLVLACVRSLCLEALLSEYATTDEHHRLKASRRATGASVLIGLALLGCTAILSVILAAGSPSPTVLTAALCLVPILLQDAWRFHWLAGTASSGALGNDLVCLVGTCAAAVVLRTWGWTGLSAILLAWGIGAGVAAAVASLQLRALPTPAGGLRWIHEHRAIGVPLAASTFTGQAAARACLVVVGSIAGLVQLGKLSASMAILAPLNVMITAAGLYGVAEGRRRIAGTNRELNGLVVRISASLLACTAALTVLCLLIPDQIGAAYLGHNWQNAQSCLIPVAIWIASTALLQGPRCGLRALGQDRKIFWLFLLLGSAQLCGAALGARLGGGVGAAWGISVASLLVLLPWAGTYRKALTKETSS